MLGLARMGVGGSVHPVVLAAFRDELEKIAVRIRVMHGTNAPYRRLLPRAATGKRPVLATDPNPSAVYMATKKRSALPGVERFARSAAAEHGGAAHVGRTKVDTRRGWGPHQLSDWARREGWTKEDLRDIIQDLDSPGRLKGADRAEAWEILNRAVGSWAPQNPSTSVPVRRWRKLE